MKCFSSRFCPVFVTKKSKKPYPWEIKITKKVLTSGNFLDIMAIPLLFGVFLLCIGSSISTDGTKSRQQPREVTFYMEVPKKMAGKEKRVKVTLACTECKQRNYDTKKNKKNNTERLELKKYCPFCRKHTIHRESK